MKRGRGKEEQNTKRSKPEVKPSEKRELLFLGIRQRIDQRIKILCTIAKWDKMLKIGILRILLLPIIWMPSLVKGISWVSMTRSISVQEQISQLSYLGRGLEFYADIYVWLAHHHALGWIFTLYLLGMISKLDSIQERERKLGLNITKTEIFKTVWDILGLYGAIKYATPFLQLPLYVVTYLFIFTSPFYFYSLRKYQKNHGSFNPSQRLKQILRSKRKQEQQLKKKPSESGVQTRKRHKNRQPPKKKNNDRYYP